LRGPENLISYAGQRENLNVDFICFKEYHDDISEKAAGRFKSIKSPRGDIS